MLDTEPSIDISRPQSFQIKGALLPLTLLEIKTSQLELVKRELTKKVEVAPSFFDNTPVVFVLDGIQDSAALDLMDLCDFCKSINLNPVGLRGGTDYYQAQARQAKMALFPSVKSRTRASRPDAAPPDTQTTNIDGDIVNNASEGSKKPLEPTEVSEPQPEQASSRDKPLIIDAPVRSGQQIFHAGDLIVMSSVSHGAELLSTGNIHVYGALRGRALAGVEGDESTRVFCGSQEAELVSVAGHYMVDEQLKKSFWKTASQIFYDGKELQIRQLSNF